jgi:hypothetical protein
VLKQRGKNIQKAGINSFGLNIRWGLKILRALMPGKKEVLLTSCYYKTKIPIVNYILFYTLIHGRRKLSIKIGLPDIQIKDFISKLFHTLLD